jgi:hypothetical protein
MFPIAFRLSPFSA